MKRKLLLLGALVALAAGGLWFARSTRPSELPSPVNGDVRVDVSPDSPSGAPRLRPPNPTQRFLEFTPEQRVEFARRGSGPGG